MGTIEAVEFASYGTPAGAGDPTCGNCAEDASCAAPRFRRCAVALCQPQLVCLPADTLTHGDRTRAMGGSLSCVRSARRTAARRPRPPRRASTTWSSFGRNAGFASLGLDVASLRAAAPSDDTVVALRLTTEIGSADGAAFQLLPWYGVRAQRRATCLTGTAQVVRVRKPDGHAGAAAERGGGRHVRCAVLHHHGLDSSRSARCSSGRAATSSRSPVRWRAHSHSAPLCARIAPTATFGALRT